MKKYIVPALGMFAAGSAFAEGDSSLADVAAHLSTISTMWTAVAGLIIGVAAVTVGVKFLRRAGR